eukprot:TRINITY_DN4573_c0_g3_i1.p2 TRINITY_DN4573_c0_g3~~TRINITY_DN4573_c0_g3_i1.p2  ORF type:complete len:173 (-),score=50.52 TRINITY_DN4573_c0_g3_i1:39-557(-)
MPVSLFSLVDQIPAELMLLKLGNNPCAGGSEYRKTLVVALKRLEELDNAEVTVDERLMYEGLLTSELAVKIAKEGLKERMAKAAEPRKKQPKMSQEEKDENIRKFAEATEFGGVVEQTEKLVKNSHKRLEKMREQSFKAIEEINDKFIKLLKSNASKWDSAPLEKPIPSDKK